MRPRQSSRYAVRTERPDWILLLSGYDPEVVQSAVASRLSTPALQEMGAQEKAIAGRYKLAFTMSSQDVAAIA